MQSKIEPALLKKILVVMSAIDSIEKRGKNSQQHYDYVMAEDMLRDVRAQFIEQGLVVLPASGTQDVIQGQTKSGATTYLTSIQVQYTICDTETGACVTLPWQAQGQDSGDKGIYKGFTGAIKTFLRNLLLLPAGDDPEHDGTKPNRDQHTPRTYKPQDKPANVSINDFPEKPAQRVVNLCAVGIQRGWTEAQVKAELKRRGASAPKDITKTLYEDTMAFLKIADPPKEDE